MSQSTRPSAPDRLAETTRTAVSSALSATARVYAAELESLDYSHLTEQSEIANERYSAISEKVQGLLEASHTTDAALEKVPEFLDKVDMLENEVAYLEEVAGELEQYAALLEDHLKKRKAK